MGKPKFSRKKYVTPSHPWQEDRIKSENELITKFGLKNKREIWKAETKLRKYRGQARELLAKIDTGDKQSKKESDQLLMHLNRLNILPVNSNLDDVLALETESILSRRLQTLTYLKGFASTPKQARQLISHGHISINGKRVTIPSYMVTREEEGEISYIDDSPLNDAMHPARPKSDFKSSIPRNKTDKTSEDTNLKQKDKKEDKSKEKPKEQRKPEQKQEEPKKQDKAEEQSKATQKQEEKPKEQKKSEQKDEGLKKQEESKEQSKTEEKTKDNKKQEEKPTQEVAKQEPKKEESKQDNKGGNE